MQDDWIFQELREAIHRRSQKPADEWFQDLIQRGVIDEKGNVLVRVPQPPGTEEDSVAPPPAAVNGATAGTSSTPTAGPLPAGACDPRPDSAQ